MIAKPLLIVLACVLAGCADRPLPVASGPVRQLNVGKWMPGPGDLALPPAPAGRSS